MFSGTKLLCDYSQFLSEHTLQKAAQHIFDNASNHVISWEMKSKKVKRVGAFRSATVVPEALLVDAEGPYKNPLGTALQLNLTRDHDFPR